MAERGQALRPHLAFAPGGFAPTGVKPNPGLARGARLPLPHRGAGDARAASGVAGRSPPRRARAKAPLPLVPAPRATWSPSLAPRGGVWSRVAAGAEPAR